jgi:heterodisulfide reductase subunit B
MLPERTATTYETLAQIIQREIGQNVYLCYQCAKCTSGCPLAEHFDLWPNQIMRCLQFNDERPLYSRTIWLCASCQTCTTRCPQGLDIAGIMDTLRIEAKRRGVQPTVPEVDKFSTLFIRDISLFGRLYEVGLMAGLNLVTGRLTKDMDMGLEMMKRGKLHLIPSFVRPPKQVRPIQASDNVVAYYPGCSLHSSAAEYNHTTRVCARVLGLELIEPPGWVCCGSTPAHSSDHLLATVLPLRTLSTVERMGIGTLTAPCSSCFSRLRAAAHAVAENDDLAARVAGQIGYAYQGRVQVQHLLDTLVERVGLDAIHAKVKRPLTGLKVACYYGCLVTRPAKITGAEHVEYPMQMDYLMRALGAETVDWSYKTDCCGGALSLTKTQLAWELTAKILRNAHDCGADAVATVCPLCQVNLDARQPQIGLEFRLPALYATQLAVLAFGFGEREAALERNLVDPRPVLRTKGLIQ